MHEPVFRQVVLLFSAILWLGASPAAGQVDFNRDIRPILSDKCFQCHGPDANHREADLRLDEPDGLYADRNDETIIVTGRPAESLLIARIVSDDPDEKMPPNDSGKSLSDEEIGLIREWVRQGAEWNQHWAFVAPVRPALPEVKRATWPRADWDRFVLARLEAMGLEPAPEADRRTLIRRLSLDLTGLPPTRDDVLAFVYDNRPEAYEERVDRLLESPHFGERMAVDWLDQARYADTNGYSIDGGRHMWLWRDWVIDAFNRNLPFDQFAIQQLAGDLLPNATTAQRVATGFNRNHMITHEGGTIPEENLVNYVSDRVKTTAEVFLGLTIGCAQCHDHKYDPITQRDYYRFFAYFNTVSDRGLDGNAGNNAVPKLKARSVFASEQRVQRTERQIADLEHRLQQPLKCQPEWEQATRKRLAQLGDHLELHPVEVIKVSSPNRGSEYEVLKDGTVFIPDGSGRSPSISAKIGVDGVSALRLVFNPHQTFPEGGLGHGRNRMKGSLLLTAFSASASTVPSDQVDLYRQARFRRVTASYAHPQHPPANALDERDHNGWSPHPRNQQPQHITFQLDEPINASDTPYVTAMLVWGGGSGLVGGRYRLFAVTGNDDGIEVPAEIQDILRIATGERSQSQAERIRQYHAQVAPELSNLRYRIGNLRERLRHLTGEHEVMVMDESRKPRETFILNRGQYDQPTEKVAPGAPECLPEIAAGAPPNRLGMAQWLVRADHPLTSRVAVNRLWQVLFGRGIVSTSADFGSQGSAPTHPLLLDWLALDFVENQWNVKTLLKQIVMSATYRQSSRVSDELARSDPNNRWLARGPRFRLQAEFIRDNALAVSGLLVQQIGGPSVKPYQPAGLWKEISHYGSTPATAQVFVQDHGDDLYRRSMYTYWKRTAPPPSMISFDAPNREICTVQRSATNTPLQALVLLNDPQFVEASRALGQRIVMEGGSTVDARIRFAVETVTSRPASAQEIGLLREVYKREITRFRQRPADAQASLNVGEVDREDSIAIEDHATWSTVAMLLLNLSETITRE